MNLPVAKRGAERTMGQEFAQDVESTHHVHFVGEQELLRSRLQDRVAYRKPRKSESSRCGSVPRRRKERTLHDSSVGHDDGWIAELQSSG